MQYMRIFGKKGDDFTQYWTSISTELMKDGKGTGKYARANMTVRLSREAEDVFKENRIKTATKGTYQLNAKVTDFWLKAIRPSEGEDFVVIFVNAMEPAEPDEDEDD